MANVFILATSSNGWNHFQSSYYHVPLTDYLLNAKPFHKNYYISLMLSKMVSTDMPLYWIEKSLL